MNDEKWSDEEQEKIDLELENRSLETEIKLKGGIFGKEKNLDPSLENAFLKSIIAFEEGDKDLKIPMRAIFPDDYKFPPVGSMSKKVLSDKLDDIIRIFEDHHIELDFSEEVPDKVLYKYLVETCIAKEMIEASIPAGTVVHLTGCTGFCEECFQKDYCPDIEED
jgi:hypothetical protein